MALHMCYVLKQGAVVRINQYMQAPKQLSGQDLSLSSIFKFILVFPLLSFLFHNRSLLMSMAHFQNKKKYRRVQTLGYSWPNQTIYVNIKKKENLKVDVQFIRLQRGEFNIIYAHPETVSTKKFGLLLRPDLYQENVCAVVVDEVHMISEWYIIAVFFFIFHYFFCSVLFFI